MITLVQELGKSSHQMILPTLSLSWKLFRRITLWSLPYTYSCLAPTLLSNANLGYSKCPFVSSLSDLDSSLNGFPGWGCSHDACYVLGTVLSTLHTLPHYNNLWGRYNSFSFYKTVNISRGVKWLVWSYTAAKWQRQGSNSQGARLLLSPFLSFLVLDLYICRRIFSFRSSGEALHLVKGRLSLSWHAGYYFVCRVCRVW